MRQARLRRSGFENRVRWRLQWRKDSAEDNRLCHERKKKVIREKVCSGEGPTLIWARGPGTYAQSVRMPAMRNQCECQRCAISANASNAQSVRMPATTVSLLS
eukprot:2122959-Pleurochrysis_carterae.AAC.1